MTPLFISLVCDYCDGLAMDEENWDRGYVVWRGRPLPVEEYVFQTYEDAERWKVANAMTAEPILLVIAPLKFRWRRSTGTLRDITTADRLVTIYPDHRFPPGPNRACLAPAS